MSDPAAAERRTNSRGLLECEDLALPTKQSSTTNPCGNLAESKQVEAEGNIVKGTD